jgi:hypothetical protein
MGGSQVRWLMPVILDIQAIEIGRIEVRSQLRQKVQETPPTPSQLIKMLGVVVLICHLSY